MWAWLASFLAGPVVNGLIGAYKAKLDAANSAGAQAADLAAKAIAAEIEARRSANALIIAEQGRWYTAIIRPLLAAPVIIYLEGDRVGQGARPRLDRRDRRRRRRLGRHDRHHLCGRPLAGKNRAHHLEPHVRSIRSPNERLAVLEQKVSHMEEELDRMSAKVDEMHAILLQAKGVRWAIIAVSGLVGFLAGLAHWLISKV